MRSGEYDLATLSRISLTPPQTAGSLPSGKSNTSTAGSTAGMKACAALRASSLRAAVPVSTTYLTCGRLFARLSSKPPAPISMSSGCAPTASRDNGLPEGAFRRSGSMRFLTVALRWPPLRCHRGRPGSLRHTRTLGIPDHPGAIPALVHLFQQRAFLHRVRWRPVSLVRVRQNSPLRDQSDKRVLDEVLALLDVIENLRPEDDGSAVRQLWHA